MPDMPASWDNLHERFETKGSAIRRHTASMARALTWLKNSSRAFAAPKSEVTTLSLVPMSCGSPVLFPANRGQPRAPQ
jgi:hypothetical protein